MVRAQYRLVTEHLGLRRVRLVIGNSMGGMHTWMWAQKDQTAGHGTTGQARFWKQQLAEMLQAAARKGK